MVVRFVSGLALTLVLLVGSVTPAGAWTQGGCLWPHTPGQLTYTYFSWGTEIDWDPKTNWRNVYTSGQGDWNGAQGRISLSLQSDVGQLRNYL